MLWDKQTQAMETNKWRNSTKWRIKRRKSGKGASTFWSKSSLVSVNVLARPLSYSTVRIKVLVVYAITRVYNSAPPRTRTPSVLTLKQSADHETDEERTFGVL